MVDRGHGRLKNSPEIGLAAVLGHDRSLETAQWREGCTESPSRASPGRGWWCGDRATVVKRRRRWHSIRAVLEHGEKRRRAGRGEVEDGGSLPFIGAEGEGGGW
jgi:hypothetical protein